MINSIKVIISWYLLCQLSASALCQTGGNGNPEGFTRETYVSTVGLFATNIKLPESPNDLKLRQYGLVYSYGNDMANLGSYVIGKNSEIRFTIQRFARIGFAAGISGVTIVRPDTTIKNLKYHLLELNFLTLNITPEYTTSFNDGTALIVKCGVAFLNLGGTIAFMDKSKIEKNTIVYLDFIPLSFSPSIIFDFGRTGLGIGATINPFILLAYKNAPSPVFPASDKGMKYFDWGLGRYQCNVVFTFEK